MQYLFLKKYLEEKCKINIYTPKYVAGKSYEWDNKQKQRISLISNVKFEREVNNKLEAKTVFLTLR